MSDDSTSPLLLLLYGFSALWLLLGFSALWLLVDPLGWLRSWKAKGAEAIQARDPGVPDGDEQESGVEQIRGLRRAVPGDLPDRIWWCNSCPGVVEAWGRAEIPPPRCPDCHKNDFDPVPWVRVRGREAADLAGVAV